MSATKVCLGIGATVIVVGIAAPAVVKVVKEVVAAVYAFTLIVMPLMVLEALLKK